MRHVHVRVQHNFPVVSERLFTWHFQLRPWKTNMADFKSCFFQKVMEGIFFFTWNDTFHLSAQSHYPEQRRFQSPPATSGSKACQAAFPEPAQPKSQADYRHILSDSSDFLLISFNFVWVTEHRSFIPVEEWLLKWKQELLSVANYHSASNY